ncbi:MAG: hypothetical protein GWN76_08500 [candidate division Zixibacteria bacterium]|nr:hypothetical protein [candidate division Zixibacteria bacterium]NIU14038.1 hypothetical protein [candidate division Zixibacteria bacterium]
MAMDKPDYTKFEFWLGMQETSGTRYDATANGRDALGGFFSGWDAPNRQAAGHVSTNSCDFERSTVDGLYIPDGSWQSGDKDWCMGGWFRLETDECILMCQGGRGNTSCWCCYIDTDPHVCFGVGISGSSGWNNSYRARATSTTLSTATWYFYLARSDASANTGYVYVYNTSGTLLDSDSTSLMNFGSNDAGAITFGHTNSSVYKYETPVYGNVQAMDARLEQWFLYDGWLTTNEVNWILNGGAGRTWADFFDSGGRPFFMSI